MPFEVMETETKDSARPLASLSYMRHVRKGREMDRSKYKPKLIVTLPTVVCISKKERFEIMVGTGEDQGKVRIAGTADKKRGVKASDFKNYIILRFGYVPALGDEIFDGVKVAVEKISEDVYELNVPPELFKDAAVKLLKQKVKVVA